MLNLTSPEGSYVQSSILLLDRNYNQCEFQSEIPAKNNHFPARKQPFFPLESSLAAFEVFVYNNTVGLCSDRIEHTPCLNFNFLTAIKS
jgi:hypothetical protein